MRLLILTLGLAVLFTGCSPSRLTDSERILSPGNHKHGTGRPISKRDQSHDGQ
jgi:hypothetical protein